MAVPEIIRKVQRPVNTIVAPSSKASPDVYPVRERLSVEYVKGGNPQPVNGKVIGHIINGMYIPLVDSVSRTAIPEMLSFGASAFAESQSRDIYSDLLKVYSIGEAKSIMALASLKVLKPRIKSVRMRSEYERQYISLYYPGAALSPNSISDLYKAIGKAGKRRRSFYGLRIARVMEDHHIAIDGMLKQDSSIVNDLSAFSRKARVKGTKDISVLYAYDLEKKEPICAEVFPGNNIDAASYSSFIKDNNITKGIIVADKGFPPSKITEELSEHPDLHFLTPIKRNDKRVSDNDMLTFDGMVEGIDRQVLCKKAQIKGGRFLYSFRDRSKAEAEEYSLLKRMSRDKGFSQEDYYGARDSFGTIVFLSDLDMEPKTAYLCYAERWKLELVFGRYKNDDCLDCTNVQGDFSVYGEEFVNFIATIITSRLVEKAERSGLLDDNTFGDLMDDLSSAWRLIDAPKEARSDDDGWVHALAFVKSELEILGLSTPPAKPEPKKRGRKPKDKSVVEKPKRPRGRPRKNLAV